MEYNEQLKEYGILATNAAKVSIKDKDKELIIISAQIDEMKLECEKLKAKKIKKINIFGSEIQYIYFNKDTTIDINFGCCNFKNQVIARECNFNNTIAFTQCIFETMVDFSSATFNCQTIFLNSIFKAEARFIATQFLAKQGNGEIIENDFIETIFEGNTSFSRAKFEGRVSFRISIFKGKANFIETKFLAKQGNGEIIENDFIETIFEGNTSFSRAKFEGRVSFGISKFKDETSFIETQFLVEQSDNNKIAENDFRQSIFEGNTYFSGAEFKGRVSFVISRFKAEASFIKTKFLAKQGNGEIENDFRETIFEGNTSFDNAIFQGRVSFGISKFKDETSFIETQFLVEQSDNNKIAENDFRQSIFEGNTYFSGAEFKGRVSFRISIFKAEARFIKTKFLAEQGNSEIENNFRETTFEGNTYFSSITLQGIISFEFSSFMKETLFIDTNTQNCIFNHTEFNKTKFIKKNYKNAETYTFRNSTFKDTLRFENLNINKLEFDNVVFNGIVTFNNTNSNKPSFTNCTFSNQFNIEHKYIQYSYEDIEKTQDYSQLLNYRDLFRKLKSNRIAHHNLIDASELHSQELYARELELRQKETKTLKDKIEKWQLWFYYKLCDHHTDILKSFHSLMLVIGLFGFMGGVIIIGFNYYLGYKPFSHLYMVKEIYDAHIQSFIKTHTLCTIVFNFFILASYLGMLFISIKWKILRGLFIVVSYVVVISILLISPKILIPAMGIFTDKRALLDPLSTLGGIYTICFGFVLFSFIKTIRKNSIVPN